MSKEILRNAPATELIKRQSLKTIPISSEIVIDVAPYEARNGVKIVNGTSIEADYSEISRGVLLDGYVTHPQLEDRFFQQFKPFWLDSEITDISVYNSDGSYEGLMQNRNVRRFILNDKGTTICGCDESSDVGGHDTGVLRSTDKGKTFVKVGGLTDIFVQSLDYGNGKWVVVSDIATYLNADDSAVFVSEDDGLTFKRLAFSTDTNLKIKNLDGSDFDRRLFRYRGTNGDPSTYGYNETTKTVCTVVKFLNGKFWFNFGASYKAQSNRWIMMYSEDLKNFTVVDTSHTGNAVGRGFSDVLWDINYGNGIYVGTSYGNGICISEDDGNTWRYITTGNNNVDFADIKSCCYHDGIWVAASKGDSYGNVDMTKSGLFSSTDGKNWTWLGAIANDKDQIMNKFYAVAYGAGGWFAVATGTGSYIGGICYSEDGLNWKYLFPGKYKACFVYDGFWYAYDLTTNANKLI